MQPSVIGCAKMSLVTHRRFHFSMDIDNELGRFSDGGSHPIPLSYLEEVFAPRKSWIDDIARFISDIEICREFTMMASADDRKSILTLHELECHHEQFARIIRWRNYARDKAKRSSLPKRLRFKCRQAAAFLDFELDEYFRVDMKAQERSHRLLLWTNAEYLEEWLREFPDCFIPRSISTYRRRLAWLEQHRISIPAKPTSTA
jgi:hypothetical protein